jgi:dUTP pyrophosphatase
MEKIKVKIKKMHEDAKIPIHATEGSAGFDFYSIETKTIQPGETTKVSTGIALEIPQGYCMQIWGRSGLEAKGVHKLAGLGDSDYRGEYWIVLKNSTDKEYTIEKHDRIAQGIIVPVFQADFQEVSELSETQRGEGGFHSTGKK